MRYVNYFTNQKEFQSLNLWNFSAFASNKKWNEKLSLVWVAPWIDINFCILFCMYQCIPQIMILIFSNVLVFENNFYQRFWEMTQTNYIYT